MEAAGCSETLVSTIKLYSVTSQMTKFYILPWKQQNSQAVDNLKLAYRM
jgi:hypothetical protein